MLFSRARARPERVLARSESGPTRVRGDDERRAITSTRDSPSLARPSLEVTTIQIRTHHAAQIKKISTIIYPLLRVPRHLRGDPPRHQPRIFARRARTQPLRDPHHHFHRLHSRRRLREHGRPRPRRPQGTRVAPPPPTSPTRETQTPPPPPRRSSRPRARRSPRRSRRGNPEPSPREAPRPRGIGRTARRLEQPPPPPRNPRRHPRASLVQIPSRKPPRAPIAAPAAVSAAHRTASVTARVIAHVSFPLSSPSFSCLLRRSRGLRRRTRRRTRSPRAARGSIARWRRPPRARVGEARRASPGFGPPRRAPTRADTRAR